MSGESASMPRIVQKSATTLTVSVNLMEKHRAKEECCSLTPPLPLPRRTYWAGPGWGWVWSFGGVELSACWSWGRRLLETGGRVTKPEAGRATDPGCHRPRPRWGPSFPPLSLGQAELPSLTLSAGLIWHFLRSLLFYPSLPFIWAQGDLIGRDLIGVPVTSSLSRQPAVAETRELALWGAVSPYLGAGHSQYSPL